MKLINKIFIIIALIFIAVSGIISVINWILNDEGFTTTKLFTEMLGKFGGTVDRTIKFAYIGNLLLTLISCISIFFVLIIGWQYKKQQKPIKQSFIVVGITISTIILALAIAVIIETNNLMNESWFSSHAVLI